MCYSPSSGVRFALHAKHYVVGWHEMYTFFYVLRNEKLHILLLINYTVPLYQLIIHFFYRFANSLAYYGLSLNTGHLSGNPFLILFVLGFVELPSYVGTVFLMDRTGRRPLISSLMLLGGICCIISTYIPQGSSVVYLTNYASVT